MDNNKSLVALKKAHTLLGRIIKMSEDKEYCVDIMQQNLAAIGLLKSAHQSMLDAHLHHCFRNAMNSSSETTKDKMIEEILKVSKIANR